MVNFIKPSFLGTDKEFANLYVNPIKNGQHKDSSKSEIKHMKQRSYVLHKKLSKFVQVSCWIIFLLRFFFLLKSIIVCFEERNFSYYFFPFDLPIEKRSCFVEIIPAGEIRIRFIHSDDKDSNGIVRVFFGKSTESRTEWKKFDSRLHGFAKGNE